jgi:hypothetical protein
MKRLQVCAVAALLGACSGTGENAPRAAATDEARRATAAPAPAPTERSDAMDWYVSYTLDLPEGQVLVLVYPGGESAVTTTGLLGEMVEIGHYRTRLGPDRCQAVRDILRTSGYDQLPPPEPQLPDTGFMSVGEGVAGQAPTMRGFPLHDVPAALRPVMAELELVIEEIRAHPHHVIGGVGRWTPAEVQAGQVIAFELELTNRGPAPAELLNPAWPAGYEQAPMILSVGRDLPPDQFNEERDLDQVQLSPQDLSVRRADGSKLAAAETLTFGPGESLYLSAAKKVYLAPGRFRGTVTLRAAGGKIDEAQLVKGVLHVKLGPLVVGP